MRWAWLLVFAGCQFSVTLAPESEIPFCDPNEPMLVACYELDGTTRDGTANQLHASMTDVTFIGGMAGLAMQFGATSAADVADSPKFDVAALTIEAWIAPLMLPATGQRAGILDMNGQYGFFVHEAGRLQCTAGGANSLQLDANISTAAWTHVACAYDGVTMRVYVNGAKLFEGGGGGAISTGGSTGISIGADNPPGSGSRLIGAIDQVRLWARVRTDAEICEAAGCE